MPRGGSVHSGFGGGGAGASAGIGGMGGGGDFDAQNTTFNFGNIREEDYFVPGTAGNFNFTPRLGVEATILATLANSNLGTPGQVFTTDANGNSVAVPQGAVTNGGGGVNSQPTLQQTIQSILSGNPITDAATLQADAYTQGQELLAPYLNAGTNALPALSASATPGGMDDMLNQILNGDNFQSLVDERQRGIQGQLAAGGLTRSGTAMQAAADVPTDLAFQLEGLLNGRNQNLVNQGNNAALSTSSLITGGAEATASGILGNHQQNINQQNIDDQNNNALIASVISLFGN